MTDAQSRERFEELYAVKHGYACRADWREMMLTRRHLDTYDSDDMSVAWDWYQAALSHPTGWREALRKQPKDTGHE